MGRRRDEGKVHIIELEDKIAKEIQNHEINLERIKSSRIEFLLERVEIYQQQISQHAFYYQNVEAQLEREERLKMYLEDLRISLLSSISSNISLIPSVPPI
jgi:hypothetical protein